MFELKLFSIKYFTKGSYVGWWQGAIQNEQLRDLMSITDMFEVINVLENGSNMTRKTRENEKYLPKTRWCSTQ